MVYMEANTLPRLRPTARAIMTFIFLAINATEREAIASVKPRGRADRWGNSYFAPRNSIRNGFKSSLVRRGLIEVTNVKVGNARTFRLTPRGLAALLLSSPSV